MTFPLRPKRGGFLRVVSCGLFIRDFLLGLEPYGSPRVDPNTGTYQSFIFKQYKLVLMRTSSEDQAIRTEESIARRESRRIDPDNIDKLIKEFYSRMPYKAHGCRYHSFITYFSMIQKLLWVKPTGEIENSHFQGKYSEGQPRVYFHLTEKGKAAPDSQWANPHKVLYGY
ncbi:MAG: hypothetical protein JW762_06405 [Dehalococcoidales bacterium]|nr:hypothetical protein [Dehalococcoidales bacterium]